MVVLTKMLPNRQQPISQENPLWLSWHDTQMMPTLTPQNVMDYFCRKSNPFYDRVCNNETIRMQRLSPEHLNNMVGVEYMLLHVAEPILYVIRKQHRHSPTETTPLADYYIIGGIVYKAPDLANVINSRLLSTVANLQSAFEEASSYARYNPNRGYTWDFSANKAISDKSKTAAKKESSSKKDDNGTVFQMQRVDMLLSELLRKFPPPVPPIVQQQQLQQQQQQQHQQQSQAQSSNTQEGNNPTENPTSTTATATTNNISNTTNTSEASPTPTSNNIDIKTEISDMPPPEKKIKLSS